MLPKGLRTEGEEFIKVGNQDGIDGWRDSWISKVGRGKYMELAEKKRENKLIKKGEKRKKFVYIDVA